MSCLKISYVCLVSRADKAHLPSLFKKKDSYFFGVSELLMLSLNSKFYEMIRTFNTFFKMIRNK